MNKIAITLFTITAVVGVVFILLLATVGFNRAVADANSVDDETDDGSADGVTGDPTMYGILSVMPRFDVFQFFDNPSYAQGIIDWYDDPSLQIYPYINLEEGMLYDDWKLQLLPGEVTSTTLEVWVTANITNGAYNYDESWESKHTTLTFDYEQWSAEEMQSYLFKTRFFFWVGGSYMMDIHIFGKLNGGEAKEIGTPYQSLVEVNLL